MNYKRSTRLAISIAVLLWIEIISFVFSTFVSSSSLVKDDPLHSLYLFSAIVSSLSVISAIAFLVVSLQFKGNLRLFYFGTIKSLLSILFGTLSVYIYLALFGVIHAKSITLNDFSTFLFVDFPLKYLPIIDAALMTVFLSAFWKHSSALLRISSIAAAIMLCCNFLLSVFINANIDNISLGMLTFSNVVHYLYFASIILFWSILLFLIVRSNKGRTSAQ